ncbi:hypothetical protein FHG87_010808 [Trinorchestia longiramus]|nr:hypothetical protein FHG87_010808 [Trinorchestia longiramus]
MTVRCGSVTVRCGSVTVKCGSVTVKCGSVTVKCGSVTVRCGGVTVKCGSVTVSPNKLKALRSFRSASSLRLQLAHFAPPLPPQSAHLNHRVPSSRCSRPSSNRLKPLKRQNSLHLRRADSASSFSLEYQEPVSRPGTPILTPRTVFQYSPDILYESTQNILRQNQSAASLHRSLNQEHKQVQPLEVDENSALCQGDIPYESVYLNIAREEIFEHDRISLSTLDEDKEGEPESWSDEEQLPVVKEEKELEALEAEEDLVSNGEDKAGVIEKLKLVPSKENLGLINSQSGLASTQVGESGVHDVEEKVLHIDENKEEGNKGETLASSETEEVEALEKEQISTGNNELIAVEEEEEPPSAEEDDIITVIERKHQAGGKNFQVEYPASVDHHRAEEKSEGDVLVQYKEIETNGERFSTISDSLEDFQKSFARIAVVQVDANSNFKSSEPRAMIEGKVVYASSDDPSFPPSAILDG